MKKIIALLPILLLAGLFTFTADTQQNDNKAQDVKPQVQRMMVDPGGGGI
ncbi:MULTISPECIES: complement C1q protein [Bacillus cereus group]|nr:MULTISPECIES: complement C1q protein [Bacillus cereus group]MBG9716626.1 complement C1q protein [Bacillus cereus]MED2874033.1 complement C1q protein [Bacillus thuringiensis]PEZ32016.1 complement C1q protein [Bacillus thuringiensis]PFV83971.1 complement C1q protein [Bacillus thuringiensis]PGY57322.1 complement C1q protein [Bacillus thuringiensis]